MKEPEEVGQDIEKDDAQSDSVVRTLVSVYEKIIRIEMEEGLDEVIEEVLKEQAQEFEELEGSGEPEGFKEP